MNTTVSEHSTHLSLLGRLAFNQPTLILPSDTTNSSQFQCEGKTWKSTGEFYLTDKWRIYKPTPCCYKAGFFWVFCFFIFFLYHATISRRLIFKQHARWEGNNLESYYMSIQRCNASNKNAIPTYLTFFYFRLRNTK